MLKSLRQLFAGRKVHPNHAANQNARMKEYRLKAYTGVNNAENAEEEARAARQYALEVEKSSREMNAISKSREQLQLANEKLDAITSALEMAPKSNVKGRAILKRELYNAEIEYQIAVQKFTNVHGVPPDPRESRGRFRKVPQEVQGGSRKRKYRKINRRKTLRSSH